MEVVAAVSAIIAVADASVKLTTAVSNYASSVKNYTQSLSDLTSQLGLMQTNFENLKKRLSNNSALRSWIDDMKAPLEDCLQRLNEVRSIFEKRTSPTTESMYRNPRANMQKFLWPLKEAQIKEFVTNIQGYTTQFTFSVAIDTQ